MIRTDPIAEDQIFIWTEVFNCGELSKIVIPSFLANHKDSPVHVYGFEDDLKYLPQDPRVIPMRLPTGHSIWRKKGRPEDYVREGYKRGHLGTARLFAHVFETRQEPYLIHFDADIIFVGPAIQQVIEALVQENVLAGLRRAYLHNPHGRDDVRHLSDCVDTVCLGVSRRNLPGWHHAKMVRNISGSLTRIDRFRGRRVIDFFDPVTLEMAKSGPVAYLDSPEAGVQGVQDNNSNFYKSFIQVWSAVGSGCSFSKYRPPSVPEPYVEYALQSYRLYAHYLLGERSPEQLPPPGAVEEKLKRLNQTNWKIE